MNDADWIYPCNHEMLGVIERNPAECDLAMRTNPRAMGRSICAFTVKSLEFRIEGAGFRGGSAPFHE